MLLVDDNFFFFRVFSLTAARRVLIVFLNNIFRYVVRVLFVLSCYQNRICCLNDQDSSLKALNFIENLYLVSIYVVFCLRNKTILKWVRELN